MFATSTGRALSQRNVGRALRATQRRAVDGDGRPTFPILHERDEHDKPVPIPRAALPSMHGFRHTVASRAFLAGESMDEVAVMLGHANANVTRTVYMRELNDAAAGDAALEDGRRVRRRAGGCGRRHTDEEANRRRSQATAGGILMAKKRPKKQADDGLSELNYQTLNEDFYAGDPADYFMRRLTGLLLLKGKPEAIRALPAEGIETGGVLIQLQPGTTPDARSEDDDAESRDRFFTADAWLLLHHASETLLRLYLAHAKGPVPSAGGRT